MKREFTWKSRDGITMIHGIEWKPEGEVKAVLQMIHGMVEYIDRYDKFAEFLCAHGYYVVGHDHLGHGKSVQNEEAYGFFHETKGNEYIIGDIHKLREMTQEKYPDVPYFMLGHSMGSFFIREYMELYGEGLAGVIVMGTGAQPAAVLEAGCLLCRIIALFKGWKYRSRLVDNMAFGSYNKRFEPARTEKDWLTKDEQIVDVYLAHPWCTFRFTVNAYYHLFRAMQFLQKRKNIRRIPADLPLFFVAGAEDPVGNFGKSVVKAGKMCRKCGVKDVEIKLYEGDRHEILNETDRDKVFTDLMKWMDKRI